MKQPENIKPANGKLAVFLPGMGAVATTFIAGCITARKNQAAPIGSLTQLGTIRLGKRTDEKTPLIKDLIDLSSLDQLEFAGWDLFPDNAYEAAAHAKVLTPEHLALVKEEMEQIKPMPGVFSPEYVKRLNGTHIKTEANKWDLMEAVRKDIRDTLAEKGCDRGVAVWCGSTESFIEIKDVHQSVKSFEEGLRNNDADISPSMIYAWACLKEGVPYANGAPNLTVDIPAVLELARETRTPVCGKDFKTGQTLMKTILAPGLRARMLGLQGWFSTNILGNRDGEVLDEPSNFKTKEESKLGVLDAILRPDLNPELYGDFYHKVRINYYPPRGDEKEGWDNIDIKGWMDYPMQIKIDFLCRDSILAAPIVLDLALLMDYAKRAEFSGMQEWMGFYFKSPMAAEGLRAEHDLFTQLMKLKNTLRWSVGEDLITHLGNEYYD